MALLLAFAFSVFCFEKYDVHKIAEGVITSYGMGIEGDRIFEKFIRIRGEYVRNIENIENYEKEIEDAFKKELPVKIFFSGRIKTKTFRHTYWEIVKIVPCKK
jgi:hypothetical protein